MNPLPLKKKKNNFKETRSKVHGQSQKKSIPVDSGRAREILHFFAFQPSTIDGH